MCNVEKTNVGLFSIPKDEKIKLFKSMNLKAIKLYNNISNILEWNERNISVKAYFQYQPFYSKKKWILNYSEWTLPDIDFNIAKHYELERYFTRYVYYNRNLVGRDDIILREDTGGPMITFDMELGITHVENKSILPFEEIKPEIKVEFRKFFVRYEFPDSGRYSRFLDIQSRKNIPKEGKICNILMKELTINKDLSGIYINSISQDVLGKRKFKDFYLVDDWNSIPKISNDHIESISKRFLFSVIDE